MPNWCFNRLSIVGPRAHRESFLTDMENTSKSKYPGSVWPCFTFQHAFPMPDALVGTRSPRPMTAVEIEECARNYNWGSELLNERLKTALTDEEAAKYALNKLQYGAENWYDWCCKFWNTKWDAYNPLHYVGARSIVYSFDTAWSPPEIVIHRLAMMYPDLRFHLKYTLEGESGQFRLQGDAAACFEFMQDEARAALERRMKGSEIITA